MRYSKVGRREAAAARLGLTKRKKKKEKLDIEEVFYIFIATKQVANFKFLKHLSSPPSPSMHCRRHKITIPLPPGDC